MKIFVFKNCTEKELNEKMKNNIFNRKTCVYLKQPEYSIGPHQIATNFSLIRIKKNTHPVYSKFQLCRK